MRLEPQNTVRVRDRELRVWDLLLKSYEGVEIARREGVNPAVISRIETRVERGAFSGRTCTWRISSRWSCSTANGGFPTCARCARVATRPAPRIVGKGQNPQISA